MKRIFVAIALVAVAVFAAGSVSAGEKCCRPALERDSVDHIGLDNLGQGWFAPALRGHNHALPLVHGFLTETAFTHRTLIADFASIEGDESLSVEADIPLTRRLSALIEMPLALDVGGESGFGDLGLAVRAIWSEKETYTISSILNVGLPTGEDEFTLDEVSLGFSFNNWWYIGNGFGLQSSAGISWVPEIDDTETFDWSLMVSKTFDSGLNLFGASRPLSVFAEVAGSTPFDSDLDTTGQWGFGFNMPVLRGLDLRAGYYRSFEDGNDGILIGAVWEF